METVVTAWHGPDSPPPRRYLWDRKTERLIDMTDDSAAPPLPVPRHQTVDTENGHIDVILASDPGTIWFRLARNGAIIETAMTCDQVLTLTAALCSARGYLITRVNDPGLCPPLVDKLPPQP